MAEDALFHNGHRERLREKFLQGKLTAAELLEFLLGFAIPRRDLRPLSRRLLAEFGGIHQVLSASQDQLMKIDGVGKTTALLLMATHEIMTHAYKSVLKEESVYCNPDRMDNYCRMIVGGKTIEEFHVLFLDAEYRLLEDWTHSVGTVNWSAVYPREIIKKALDLNARSVVLVHNHPTPNMSFSDDDVAITETLMDLLKAMGLALHDHFLVSGDIVYSIKGMQLLNKRK